MSVEIRVQVLVVSSKLRSILWMLQTDFSDSSSFSHPSRQQRSGLEAFDDRPLTICLHWPASTVYEVAHAAGSTLLLQQIAASSTVVVYCGDSVPSKNTRLVSLKHTSFRASHTSVTVSSVSLHCDLRLSSWLLMPASQTASFSSSVIGSGIVSVVLPSPFASNKVVTLVQASPTQVYVTTCGHAPTKVMAAPGSVSALLPLSQHTSASWI